MTLKLGELGTLLVGTRSAMKENRRLKVEVQRQFELRRLEWNRAEALQAQVNELQKKLAQLERAASEQGSPE